MGPRHGGPPGRALRGRHGGHGLREPPRAPALPGGGHHAARGGRGREAHGGRAAGVLLPRQEQHQQVPDREGDGGGGEHLRALQPEHGLELPVLPEPHAVLPRIMVSRTCGPAPGGTHTNVTHAPGYFWLSTSPSKMYATQLHCYICQKAPQGRNLKNRDGTATAAANRIKECAGREPRKLRGRAGAVLPTRRSHDLALLEADGGEAPGEFGHVPAELGDLRPVLALQGLPEVLELLPLGLAVHRWAIVTARSRKSATFSKSASWKPREVRAGVPMRMPPGTRALVSPGTVFLFTAMCAISMMRSARAPSTPLGRRSIRQRWLLVPPETSS